MTAVAVRSYSPLTGAIALDTVRNPAGHSPRPQDNQRVPEAPRGEQAGRLPLALDERVGGRGRAVREVARAAAELFKRQPVLGGRQLEALDHAETAILRRGGRLEDPDGGVPV